jgi:hypothetical protein
MAPLIPYPILLKRPEPDAILNRRMEPEGAGLPLLTSWPRHRAKLQHLRPGDDEPVYPLVMENRNSYGRWLSYKSFP